MGINNKNQAAPSDQKTRICRHVRESALQYFALFVAAFTLLLSIETAVSESGSQTGERKRSVSEKLIYSMRDVPEHLVPLFPVGDVNEDGRVDGSDHLLIKSLAGSKEKDWEAIAEATCPGAADLDMDGDVDDGDVGLAEELMVKSKISTPALFYQAALPCRFERLTVAVQLFAMGGEVIPIWVLRPGFDQKNTAITVDSGPAVIRQSDHKMTYLLEVDSKAKDDDMILLKIVFGEKEAYWLTLPVYSAGKKF